MRRIHHVGTVPAAGTAAAMRLMLEHHAEALETIPDGENTEGRENWIIPIVRRRQAHPHVLVLRRDRFDKVPMRLWHAPLCIPRRAMTFDMLALEYSRWALEASTVLGRLVPTLARPPWRNGRPPELQVDVAGPFDLAAMTWGPLALAYHQHEIAAAADEIRTINSAVSGSVTYQLSVPVETYLVARAGHLAPRVAHWCAGLVAELVAAAPPGIRVIVHLCVGDPHGQPLVILDTAWPLALLADAICQAWPQGRILDAIHLPLANGVRPAPTHRSFYAPLARWRPPPGVGVIAGLAHADAPLYEQLAALAEVEDVFGREVAVSTPCGMGRRPQQVDVLMQRLTDLARYRASTITQGEPV